MTGFVLVEGVTIHVKFTYANTAVNPTLSVNETEAKPIKQYEAAEVGGNDETSGWQAGSVVSLTYDGSAWIRDQGYNTNDKVEIGSSTASKWRKVLLHPSTDDNSTSSRSATTTDKVLYARYISVQPSTGTLHATIFDGSGASLTDLNASSITTGTVPFANLPTGTSADTVAVGNHTHVFPVTSVATLTGAISASDLLAQLGLTYAMHYRGTTDVIPPESGTYAAGDVLVRSDNYKEYVYDGTNWRELGDEFSYALKDHVHGNITNAGAIGNSTNWELDENDGLLVFDASNGNKIEKSAILFDGVTETQGLTPSGTWVNYAGGTRVTLNGTDEGESVASFYAPTTAGSEDQLLVSTEGEPAWLSDSIGDKYTPTYVNQGVLTEASVTQKKAFTIAINSTGTILVDNAYCSDTYVLEIVVTSGAGGLHGPIEWESFSADNTTVPPTANSIKLTTVATTEAVSGYIITARGETLN